MKKTIPFITQRLRVLLILKQHEATGISKREASKLSGVCADSVQKWRGIYVREGIKGLLKHNKIGFKPSVFTADERERLEKKLKDPKNGLRGYVELNKWIKKEFGKDVIYRTVVNYCVTNFGSSVKTARKSHVEKEEAKGDAFKKNFGQLCQEVVATKGRKFNSVNLYFQDESRFGLMTKAGKTLTARGVKPICTFRQEFKSTYLFGAFSPINGDSLQLILPRCNADNFQIFLDTLSNKNPEEFKVLVLDNGAFHKAKKLKVPENIGLQFLPPYSPELNPAEKMWAKYKRQFTNLNFGSLEKLEDFLCELVENTTAAEITSICRYSYIFANHFWTAM